MFKKINKNKKLNPIFKQLLNLQRYLNNMFKNLNIVLYFTQIGGLQYPARQRPWAAETVPRMNFSAIAGWAGRPGHPARPAGPSRPAGRPHQSQSINPVRNIRSKVFPVDNLYFRSITNISGRLSIFPVVVSKGSNRSLFQSDQSLCRMVL